MLVKATQYSRLVSSIGIDELCPDGPRRLEPRILHHAHPKEWSMKKVIVLGVLAVVFTWYEVVTSTQSGQPAAPPSVVSLAPPLNHPWGPPQLAFDIPKGDVDTLLKNAPPGVDQMLRVVDRSLRAAVKAAGRMPD
jgi:hypothetical protein